MNWSILAGTGAYHVGSLVIWLAVFAVILWLAIYAIKKIRTGPAQQELTANEMISKFRELHSKGELSDAEFRTIKTTLAARLRQEVRGKDESV
jgi:uncharacterized membrane protein